MPSSTAAELTGLLVPEEPLRRWVGDRLPGHGPFDIERVTTGHSNELFAMRRGGRVWLLRRPPRTPLAPGAHDVLREARVLRALRDSGVPSPHPILVCDDPGVIGAPFFVMDRLDGAVLFHSLPAALDASEHRRRIGLALVDALAALHSVDWRAAGLDGFGRPDGYAARQVARWMRQWERYAVRDLPDLVRAAEWLAANVPPERPPALIHGDFGLHNVLFATEPPPRVLAVLDWETSTLGDPLTDLGYLLGNWLAGDEQARWFGSSLPYDATGFAGRAELVDRYEARTARPVDGLDWYRALGRLKIAVILEGSYARHLAGEADDPYFATLEAVVPNIAAQAWAIATGAA